MEFVDKTKSTNRDAVVAMELLFELAEWHGEQKAKWDSYANEAAARASEAHAEGRDSLSAYLAGTALRCHARAHEHYLSHEFLMRLVEKKGL